MVVCWRLSVVEMGLGREMRTESVLSSLKMYQIHAPSLLERCIFPVVLFSPTQECINPGERIKKMDADLGFAGNDCTGYGEKSKSLFSPLNLTPQTLDQMQ